MEERVGPYIIDQLLASGASGSVHRARHAGTGQEVALKRLKADLNADPDFVNRFRREARAMSDLKHPHIVRVFESGTDANGQSYIAMELMPGGSLQNKLDSLHRARLSLPVAQALAIARQVAEGLAYAHARGITHRDVKPANVLAAEDGRYALADFGVAQVVDATQLTRPRTTIGTPVYMSPEQAQGLPADGRSDLYSLGVMLYEMLAQRAPFVAETTPALLYKHVHEAPPPLGGEIPRAAAALVARLLAKRPEDRPQSAAEAIRAIDDMLPRPAAVSRHRARAIGAVVIAGLALAAGAAILAKAPGPERVDGAVGPAAIISPAKTRAPTFTPAISATPSSGPRGTVTATVQANTEWQAAGLALRPGDTLRIRQISGAWSECALTGCAFHDAAGDPGAPRAQASNAVQGCPHASLVARAGEGMPFCVGAGASVRADAGGELRLRINDTILFDNDGSVVVVVETGPP
ncbi:MAG TPA: serine/threonine-protein kinase [Thermoflexales bacterium]|nr:serine/threonine protein kinase [Anaerolineae bacterium]HQV28501.1 serine/threonine-protein kinase [Thermoflexales bacterium]HQX12231.1 serine/threonine-protein kinase [Thermoflexales bacterium]HQY25989.1 serine/threonine-protein kinase [Thermoflexales bacterium]HQZ54921.1 serine/threonine-protein kinase [Thermoflexales bacterium]